MKLNKLLAAGLFVGTLAGVGLPTAANAAVGVYLNVAPPPPRAEFVPAPRRGYVWVPGYWDVRGRHHVWRPGYWEVARRGYNYAPPVWVQRGDRWQLDRGGWRRGDRDGDGVPNRFDRAPGNPYRH
jgi:hypothetical protein